MSIHLHHEGGGSLYHCLQTGRTSCCSRGPLVTLPIKGRLEPSADDASTPLVPILPQLSGTWASDSTIATGQEPTVELDARFEPIKITAFATGLFQSLFRTQMQTSVHKIGEYLITRSIIHPRCHCMLDSGFLQAPSACSLRPRSYSCQPKL